MFDLFKLLIEWQYLNIYFLVGYALSLLGYIVVCLIPSISYDLINTFIIQSLILGDDLYWSYFMIFSSPALWFYMLLTAVTAVIPDLVLKAKENWDVSKLTREVKDKDEKVT
jgi:hypothetical protein